MKVRDSFSLNPVGNTSKYTDFINYIDTSSVNAGLLSEVSFLEDEFPSRAQRLVRPGDILYSSVRPNLRHYYLYNDSYEHAVASTGFVLLRNNSSYNTRFAFYYLSTNEVVKYLSNIAELSQSTFPSFSSKDIGKIDLPDIDRKAQDQIVSILSAYDNLIEVNNKRIKVLEQMSENLYKEWFVRFRFPGHETAEFENGIPEGWAYRRADEVIDFNPTLKTGNQTEFTIIPMEALSTNSMVLDSGCFVRQDSISGRRSQNGDTLLAKITPCLENGKTGFVMGMPENEVLGGSTEFVVMRSKALTPHYVYCIARSYYFRQTAILSMNGADGRQRVDEDKLKSTKILQPEKTVLDHFETIVTPIFDGVYQMVQENKNLIQQRDLLLPRLMSGKLEVQYALND